MENVTISVFGHIINDDHEYDLREDEVIEFKDNLIEVKSFVWEYWKERNNMNGVVDIIKKLNYHFGDQIKPKFTHRPKRKNIGTQIALDLFNDI